MAESTRPAHVMSELGLLSWRSLLVGWERGWVGRKDAIRYAVSQLVAGAADPNLRIAMLAGAEGDSDNEVGDLLELVAKEASDESRGDREQALRGWRLAHLIALSRQDLDPDDLLDRLEELYADFDYPEDMKEVGRYYFTPEEEQTGLRVGHRLARAPAHSLRLVIDRLRHEGPFPSRRD